MSNFSSQSDLLQYQSVSHDHPPTMHLPFREDKGRKNLFSKDSHVLLTAKFEDNDKS
jgi:hypothetical protein